MPLVIPHGQWLLTSNSTHYGSTVEYECQTGFRLAGAARRICLENATWSAGAPSCELITCGRPEVADQRVHITGDSWAIGSRVQFDCEYGHLLVGAVEAECTPNGYWNAASPFCRLVDCDRPPPLLDGRGHLLNGSTTFDSVVQYACLPDFKMIGDHLRRCLHTGVWSGTAPKCLQLSVIHELDGGNSLDASESEKSNLPMDGSRTIGLAAALCLLLLLLMSITVFCLKR